MIITRKALVGFILLAMIVFLTTDYTVHHMNGPPIAKNTSTFGVPQPLYPGPQSYMVKSMEYQPPIISLGNNTPIVATVIIELFTLGCYLVLKKHEPAINEYAADIMNQFKQ
jgi:hypothetical protein